MLPVNQYHHNFSCGLLRSAFLSMHKVQRHRKTCTTGISLPCPKTISNLSRRVDRSPGV